MNPFIKIIAILSFPWLCCFAACASAPDSGKSSADLIAVMDRYLGLLVKNDPSGLPVADTARITENGYAIQLGDGLFQTAEEITYKQYMADPSVGQVMVFGVAKESVLLANFMVRLTRFIHEAHRKQHCNAVLAPWKQDCGGDFRENGDQGPLKWARMDPRAKSGHLPGDNAHTTPIMPVLVSRFEG
jgi:hypothetical protein